MSSQAPPSRSASSSPSTPAGRLSETDSSGPAGVSRTSAPASSAWGTGAPGSVEAPMAEGPVVCHAFAGPGPLVNRPR